MIKVKHFLDPIEEDDGQRIWVEPFGLTEDLRQWCKVDLLLPHLGPRKDTWEWFDEHPDGWEEFRGRYHVELSGSQYTPTLMSLAKTGLQDNFTLLHQGSDVEKNTAEALREFINELEAYCPKDE